MPEYRYIAVDKSGKRFNGTLSAEDERELERVLVERGYWLIEATPHKREKRGALSGGRVKRRDLIEFCTSMQAMLSAGVSMMEALEEAVRETSNTRLQEALQAVFHNVSVGHTLHEALGQHPEIFPPQMINLVKAGEQTGNMEETFGELRRYLEWLEQVMAG